MLAINPKTSLAKLKPYAKDIAGFIVMGGEPGFNGAPYLATTPKRVAQLAKLLPKIPIQVDIGMTPKTVGAVVKAGASRCSSGSFVSSAADPKRAIRELKAAGGKYERQRT
jgi:ribulose-phosphate 3-epimerase